MAQTGDVRLGGAYVEIEAKLGNFQAQLNNARTQLNLLLQKEKDLKREQQLLNTQYQQVSSTLGSSSAQAQRLKNEINRLNAEEQLLRRNANDLNNQLNQQGQNLNRLSTHAGTLNNNFMNLRVSATQVAHAFLAIATGKFVQALIQGNAAVEETTASFEVLLNSYDKANKLTNDIVKMAAETPLETMDLSKGAKQLLAVGVELKDIMPLLQQLGDLSMGSSEKLERLIHAFGKVQTANRATLEYINIFTENGVSLIQEISSNLGITTEEFFKLSKAGKVSAQDVRDALSSMTSEGGKFYGMMEKQSKTFTGLSSTLKDNFKLILNDVGAAAFDVLKDDLEDIIQTIEDLRESGDLQKWAKQAGEAFAALVETLGNVVKFLWENRDAVVVLLEAYAGYKVMTSFTNAMLSMGGAAGLLSTAMGVLAGSILGLTVGTIVESTAMVESILRDYKELASEVDNTTSAYERNDIKAEKTAKSAREMLKRVEDLLTIQDKTTEQYDEMEKIISSLNELYPEWNLQLNDEANALNRSTEELNKYITSKEKLDRISLAESNTEKFETQLIDVQNSRLQIQNQIAYAKQEFQKLADEIKKGTENETITSDEMFAWSFSQLNLQSSIKKLEEQDKALGEEEVKLQGILGKTEEYLNNNRESTENLSEEISNLNQEFKNQDATFDTLISDLQTVKTEIDGMAKAFAEEFDGSLDEISKLSDYLSDSSKNIKLNRNQALELIKTYPQLADKLKLVSDGYEIERNVLDNLRKAKIEESRQAIQAQIDNETAVLQGVQNRIRAYNSEIASIGTLAEAQAKLAEVELAMSQVPKSQYEETGILSMYDTSTTGVGEVLNKDKAALQEIIDIYTSIGELQKQNQGYLDQLKVAGSNITKSSSSSKGETAQDKLFRDLKFARDMDKISEKEYLDTLEKLRDKYFKVGTKEWQSYTLQIKQGREKAKEEEAKANQKIYDDRRKNSDAWIEEQKFYDKISLDEQIEAYERIRTYTEEYYKKGLISYQYYQEKIKEINKKEYEIQKEQLSTAQKDNKEIYDKRYEEAKKKLEDYYDEIDKLEEERERELELSELRQQEKLYEGAVSRAGQNKLKEIQKDINSLLKEEQVTKREQEKELALEAIETEYQNLQTAQENYFKTVQSGAEETSIKIAQASNQIVEAFNRINGIISSVTGSNGTTNNSSTFNQTNNIYNNSDLNATVDMTKVLNPFSLTIK